MLLLIDGNSLIWRAAFSGGEHNIASGVITFANEVLTRFQPDSLIFCWDYGKSRFRSELYSQYKATREKPAKLDIESIYSQVDILRRYLSKMGIQQVRVSGIEADDLISWVSEYAVLSLDKDVVIVSTDKDLWQLITPRVSVFDPIRSTFATPEFVKLSFGVAPKDIPIYKALVGDTSDNIKGIKGIGEKLAIKLFEEYGSIWRAQELENVKEISKSKKLVKLYQCEDDFERDLLLTKIPSLRDLSWYIDENERQLLRAEIFANPVKDLLGGRMLAESFGKGLIMTLQLTELDFSEFPVDLPEPAKYESWPDLDSEIAQCAQCGLRAFTEDYGPTLPDGFSTAEIMIVGRNPGREELAQGKPFVGPSGALVNKLLDECGLTRQEVYITNVCKCYSEDNRVPELGEIGACRRFLQAEVDLLKPKLIIVLGNEAMASFTSWRAGVTSHCGQIIPANEIENSPVKHNAWVAVCVHPSSALRAPKNLANFSYAVGQIKRFLEKKRANIQSA